ncbi:HAMP domain-containing histidine kinase [Candidatus Falkowbacteria bacterium]|nr:HAMP domain-containing histidine kinase [Candidatus Falkowbacteria bacterium]
MLKIINFWIGLKSRLNSFIISKEKDEDKNRREFILNIILISLTSFISLANLILIKKLIFKSETFEPSQMISLGGALFILALLSFLLYLSKKGKGKEASLILITFLFLAISKMALAWGIELPPTIIFYITLIIISGILISSRFSFFLAGASALIIFILNYLEQAKITSPDLSWKIEAWDNSNIITLSFLFFVIATLAWLSNKELEKSLKRARRSEKNLALERNLLEIKVKERTKELKEIQIKELTHFRQLAEFGRLSSGLFHELANPLTAINLNMEQINELCPKNDDWKKFRFNIERVISATKKMGSFLTSVRKQITKQEEKSYFSLNKEIEEVMEILDFKARKKKVDLIFNAEKEYFLFNKQVKFYQLVANLISNAIDAYEEKEEKNKSVVITLDEGSEISETIILSVKDNACGLSEELKTKIFEDFFSTKNFTDGTGLGLTLVKSVVENDFKGTIEIESKIGVGSNFIIKIPKK